MSMLYYFFPNLRDAGPVVRFLMTFNIMFFRYFLFAGAMFLLFYIIKRQDWLYKKIQQVYPERKRIWHEFKYSLLTILIFSGIITLMGFLTKAGYTKVYYNIDERGVPYFIGTIVLVIFIHDTYFYWMHRLMHHPKLFRHVHKIHHLSHNPTPWAAYSFHPIEAIIEFGFVPIIIMLIPVHFAVMFIFALYMIAMNVMGHLGFEMFPKWFARHPIGKWHNTSTHHNMHHKMVNCNYGLYFNFWDRVMGTNHAKYEETFEKVATRPRPEKVENTAPLAAENLATQGS
ncbi:MAG: sterol desaturase family protein [Chitinophagales bacterium]|nr:sterol desaturase family protein [Chitinophagales bacterium]